MQYSDLLHNASQSISVSQEVSWILLHDVTKARNEIKLLVRNVCKLWSLANCEQLILNHVILIICTLWHSNA